MEIFTSSSEKSPESVPPHSGSAVILSIFKDMKAVGEQQEALLVRELETEITVPRCIEILNYLEENMALVGQSVRDKHRDLIRL